ncbi:GNAT family N-acetyltransferase [Agarilytica rhodophyticola]|uniref:GNAT family N-acetyltransferase n=1 Tax=Agarilytica rhodophyticola TaxID=1737490 RepID=UPI000B3432D2|nr:GNAT family N-acetyltransferase [Agarilytica rhodophyticola]
MEYILRKANNKDCDAVKAMVYSVLIEYGLQPDPEATDKDLEDFDQYYFNDHGYFAVATDQKGSVVASVGVIRLSDQSCELRKMFAYPSSRGVGLGKKLLTFAIDKARALGYKRMELQTASSLVEAVALYRASGFIEYHEENIVSRCDLAFEYKL